MNDWHRQKRCLNDDSIQSTLHKSKSAKFTIPSLQTPRKSPTDLDSCAAESAAFSTLRCLANLIDEHLAFFVVRFINKCAARLQQASSDLFCVAMRSKIQSGCPSATTSIRRVPYQKRHLLENVSGTFCTVCLLKCVK